MCMNMSRVEAHNENKIQYISVKLIKVFFKILNETGWEKRMVSQEMLTFQNLLSF